MREMTLTQAIAHAEQVAEWLRELIGARARIERLEAALREIVAEAASDEAEECAKAIRGHNVEVTG